MHNGGAATQVRASHTEARRVREKQDKGKRGSARVSRAREVLYSKKEMKFVTIRDENTCVFGRPTPYSLRDVSNGEIDRIH